MQLKRALDRIKELEAELAKYNGDADEVGQDRG